jgi:hypothetical protein
MRFDAVIFKYPLHNQILRVLQAILNFQAKPDYRSHCYEALQIESPQSVVDGLDRLAAMFSLSLVDRQDREVLK